MAEGTPVEPDSNWKNICILQDGSDAFSTFLASKKMQPTRSEELLDSSYLTSEFDWNMLKPSHKNQILQQAKKFLYLYMNYKKSADGITLYANY